MASRILKSFVLAILFVHTALSAQTGVSVKLVSGKPQYEYVVHNISGAPIVRVSIGIDDVGMGNPELLTPPLGWDFVNNTGTLSGPSGWTGVVETLEESAYFSLVWTKSEKAIAEGETLGGFRVTLASADNHYRTAHWTVLRADGSMASGTLVPLEPVVAGDVNGDGIVNCTDVLIVKLSLGKKAGDATFDARADTNNDAIVDVRDLAAVSQRLAAGTRCQ